MNDLGSIRPLDAPDPQAAAVPVRTADGAVAGLLKIDAAARVGDRVAVFGWCSARDYVPDLTAEETPLNGDLIRFDRPDVGAALGRADPGLGFVLIVRGGGGTIRVAMPDGLLSAPLALEDAVPGHALHHARAAIAESLATVAVGSAEWRGRLSLLPEAPAPGDKVFGCIDTALAVEGCGGVLSGWVAHPEGAVVWIEDDRGRAVSLASALRTARGDVRAHGPAPARAQVRPGFLLQSRGLAGSRQVRIAGCHSAGRFALPWHPVDSLPRISRTVAERLSVIPCPRPKLAERFRAVDLPFLARVRAKETARWRKLDSTLRWHGQRPDTPKITVIVPLYGRSDLVEHQLLDFARDPDFADRAELLYVVDDPGLEDAVTTLAPRLHAILGVPFGILTCGENTGFSAANNRGAAAARGRTLVFMNSDVFPRAPGWLGPLAASLENERVGLVAPRLLFPDGGIQHAGMTPRWRDALRLWTNHHPMMGFDPALDPATGLTEMPLVTGACVALRKSDFDAVGGWCTDYLIGDFEDSDLCFRIAEQGLSVAYLPEVELVHMERQSVPKMGEADFRQWVTLLNATLYNTRWSARLKDMARTDAG